MRSKKRLTTFSSFALEYSWRSIASCHMVYKQDENRDNVSAFQIIREFSNTLTSKFSINPSESEISWWTKANQVSETYIRSTKKNEHIQARARETARERWRERDGEMRESFKLLSWRERYVSFLFLVNKWDEIMWIFFLI